jgi:ABC-type branched-subunit amino acid transport system substrate-binding protein
MAAAVVLTLVLAACGNSNGNESSPATTAASGKSGAATGGGGEANRTKHVAISGVPGVSDKAITYAVIGTKQGNPLGTCILDCYTQGVKAYFAYRNSQGGIYGRQLQIGQVLDDQLNQNQVQALNVISGKKDFGDFNATLLASGWGDLDKAGMPTYTWGINATEAANRSHIFPSLSLRCADCTGRVVPYAAKLVGAHRAASLGYGVTENSKVCAEGVDKSLKMYEPETGVKGVYLNDNLAFGLPNGIGPEVSAMKKAGVDFISTCIDLNGMKTLAQELDRQGMDKVILYHPNTYNQQFVKQAGKLFEGDVVSVQFRPFEADAGNEAEAAFKEWMAKQGDQPSELAMVGWINASLAYEGLLAAGPDFDQQKVTDATNAMTDFTAGGLVEPVDWSQAHTPYTQATRSVDKGDECAALVRVHDGAFTVIGSKDKPWACWKAANTTWSNPEPMNFG